MPTTDHTTHLVDLHDIVKILSNLFNQIENVKFVGVPFALPAAPSSRDELKERKRHYCEAEPTSHAHQDLKSRGSFVPVA